VSTYEEFISGKRVRPDTAEEISEPQFKVPLFDFQEWIVRRALRLQRSAIFADCGLGKTPMQLEWARQVSAHESMPVLIVAPLAVSSQTQREGEKFSIDVTHCHSMRDISAGLNVTNYERIHKFDRDAFAGIVLDESSILKSYEGAYRQRLTEFAQNMKWRLCCTATPAPNDITELINHSEFLGIKTGKEILAMYFVQDGNTTHKWRIKGHAETKFWQWMASWSVAIRAPSDLGFEDRGFVLPSIHFHEHVTRSKPLPGELFVRNVSTLSERRDARRNSIEERTSAAADLVNAEPDEPWLIWCDLNAESAALTDLIDGAVEVKGPDSEQHKETALLGFSSGDVTRLVTKPKIAGFGMNWQHCARVVFVGLSDSYEQLYQAVRRVWRFGQDREVHVHIIISEQEGSVKANVERKERDSQKIFDEVVAHMREYQMDKDERQMSGSAIEKAAGDGWSNYLGDSFYVMDEIESDSVGLSVFSPPFPSMYAYTDDEADVGNTASIQQMIDHFRWFVGKDKLLRITKPGRHACVHLTQIPSFKWLDGHIGLRDFRGQVIELMESEGWHYYGEVCIDKDPQVKAIRTKDRGLLFKTLATDASHLHPALADYLLQFRKPGENQEPIRAGISEKYENPDGWVTADDWIKWAHPVWYDIRETDVLQYRHVREDKDEKHLCPLQLEVIKRAILLWSNPGDLVFSPFSGIGSEGYVAVSHERRFVGSEIRRSYWEAGCSNIESATVSGRRQMSLLSCDG
jgi:DNA modification methylase